MQGETSTNNGDITLAAVPLEKLDMSATGEFKKWMAPLMTGSKRIVLDMDTVSFVDSSGLGAILSCLRDLNAAGGDLKLCRVQKRVRVMFELVRMHRILGIYNTPEEAMAAFQTASEE